MIFLRELPSDFGAVAVTVSVGDLTLGILKQFTVAQLREFAKQHGVPRGGRSTKQSSTWSSPGSERCRSLCCRKPKIGRAHV